MEPRDERQGASEQDPPATMSGGLFDVLSRARDLGFLGPGPVEDHIVHARRFRLGLESLVGSDARLVDIGAGGGVPSLPVLTDPDRSEMVDTWSMVLTDASQKRCSFLSWAVGYLGLNDRVSVVRARVEQWAHDPAVRFGFDAVMARGFGPPEVTVECGVGLLANGGYLIISEPPDLRTWPADGLAKLGLTQINPEAVARTGASGLAVFRRDDELAPLPDRIPRPAGQQRSRPVFTVVPTRGAAG